MYAVNTVPTAVAQLTGERLQATRLRTIALESWEKLIPAAESNQAFLESLLLGALGGRADQRHPFGVLAAAPASGQLELYLEDDSCAELLLELLPYRDRRRTWRSVRGLGVHPERRSLHFTLPPYRSHAYASPVQRSLVIVRALRENRLSLLLERDRQRLENAGCQPQGTGKPSRLSPATRTAVSQCARTARRCMPVGQFPIAPTRVWDALSGHVGVTASPSLTDHGLDWIIERTVAADAPFHDDRLLAVFTDRVAGPGLHLLSHECSAAVCTAQWVSDKLLRRPVIGGRHLVVEADRLRSLGSEGHQEQAPWCQDTHLLGEQRGQFSTWGMDHRVVGQQSAKRAVLDRQGVCPSPQRQS